MSLIYQLCYDKSRFFKIYKTQIMTLIKILFFIYQTNINDFKCCVYRIRTVKHFFILYNSTFLHTRPTRDGIIYSLSSVIYVSFNLRSHGDIFPVYSKRDLIEYNNGNEYYISMVTLDS